MTSGRSSTFVVVSTVAALLMVCGTGACAKSRKRVLSEPDTAVEEPNGGGGRQLPAEPEPGDREPRPSTTPDEPPPGIAVPMGPPSAGSGEPDNPPDPPDPVPDWEPPPIVGPPPVVIHERAPGAAVLDIDPDAPRSWMDRILCEKMLDCGLSGLELLTQEECEALFGGSCAMYPQVPEE